MNKGKQTTDIQSNPTDVIHNSSQKRLPYESIKWENGGWTVKMWKQFPSLPSVPPLPRE
jgi:hypothetical protein